MRVVLLALLVVACGGKIEGDAGSPQPDGSAPGQDGSIIVTDAGRPPDVVVIPSCTTPSDTVSIGQSSCQAQTTWSCGATTYTVTCSCPSAQCTCSEQSGGMGSGTILPAPPGTCPGCSSSVPLSELCGFPH